MNTEVPQAERRPMQSLRSLAVNRRRRRKFFGVSKKENEPALPQPQFTMAKANDSNEKRRSFWRAFPGAPHLRYDPAHRLIAWQPHRVLDDRLMRRIASWILSAHTISLPFNRFVDLSRLTEISIHLHHGFGVRSEALAEDGPIDRIKCALFCDKPVGFAIARFYETFAKDSLIEVRAFCERAAAAEWLKVPASVLRLRDEARPHLMNSFAAA
jgi:hypothetical protein